VTAGDGAAPDFGFRNMNAKFDIVVVVVLGKGKVR
jgi:hypothetical protein